MVGKIIHQPQPGSWPDKNGWACAGPCPACQPRRSSIVPAAMHDLRSIRENPEAFDAGLARRGAEPASARILEIDERRRAVTTRVQEAQARRNEASKAIGAAMGKGDTSAADALKAEVAQLKETMPALRSEERRVGKEGGPR